MADFSTTASLELTEASLQAAEQTIADRLGTVSVAVEADAPAPAPDAGAASQSLSSAGGAGPSVTGGTTASEPEGIGATLTALLEVEESALEELEDLNGGGGGLFGEGGVLSLVSETAVNAGGEVAGTTGEVLAGAVGPAIGSAVGSALPELLGQGGGSDVSGSVSVTEPEWAPLAVEDPGTVSVEGVDDVEVGLTKPEWVPLNAPKPGWVPVAVDDPSPLGVSDPSPLGVETPTLPVEQPTLSVNAPESIPVSFPTGQGQQPVSQQGPDQGFADSVIEGAGKGAAAGSGLGVAAGFAGGPFAPVSVPAGGVAGGAIGGTIGGVAGGIDFLDEQFQSRSRRVGSVQQQPAEVSITNRPQYDLTVELDRDRIRRIVEDAQRDNLQELEDRVDDVEREVDRVRRSFSGARGR